MYKQNLYIDSSGHKSALYLDILLLFCTVEWHNIVKQIGKQCFLLMNHIQVDSL